MSMITIDAMPPTILETIAEMLNQCDASDVTEEIEAFAAENNVVIVLGATDTYLLFRGAIHRDVANDGYAMLYLSSLGDVLCGRFVGCCVCCDFINMVEDVIQAEYNLQLAEWVFETKLNHCKVSVVSQEEGTRYGIAYVVE